VRVSRYASPDGSNPSAPTERPLGISRAVFCCHRPALRSGRVSVSRCASPDGSNPSAPTERPLGVAGRFFVATSLLIPTPSRLGGLATLLPRGEKGLIHSACSYAPLMGEGQMARI